MTRRAGRDRIAHPAGVVEAVVEVVRRGTVEDDGAQRHGRRSGVVQLHAKRRRFRPDALRREIRARGKEGERRAAAVAVDAAAVERDQLIGRDGRVVQPQASGCLPGCHGREADADGACAARRKRQSGLARGGHLERGTRGRVDADVGEGPRRIAAIGHRRVGRRSGADSAVAEHEGVGARADLAACNRVSGGGGGSEGQRESERAKPRADSFCDRRHE